MAGCTRLVKPMLNDATYMFPTTLKDVDAMCKMWSGFVDCVRRYMSACSSEGQRVRFNRAVAHSMDTVHAICSSDAHQKDYLESAHCFRRVSVHSCGRYYRSLVSQVANRGADDTHICCAYGQFKSCASAPLLRSCGLKVHALLDHSLAYLVSACSSSFYPLSYTCPTAPPPPPTMSIITTATPVDINITTIEDVDEEELQSLTTRGRTIIFPLPPTQGSRVSGTPRTSRSWWLHLGVLLWLLG